MRPHNSTMTMGTVGPQTQSGGASAGCILSLLYPPGTTGNSSGSVAGKRGLENQAGVCHCVKCTRTIASSSQSARVWAGGRQHQVPIPTLASTEAMLDRDVYKQELSLIDVTINEGGVGATLSLGSIGRSGDAVHFRPCIRCKGLSFSSTHPYAIRWWCTVCGWSYVLERWRVNEGECIPPRSSCTWPEHADVHALVVGINAQSR